MTNGNSSRSGTVKGIWILGALAMLGMGSAFAYSGPQGSSRDNHRLALSGYSSLGSPGLTQTEAVAVSGLGSTHPRAPILVAGQTPTRTPRPTDTRWPSATPSVTLTPTATCPPGAWLTPRPGSTRMPEDRAGNPWRCLQTPTPTAARGTVIGHSVADRDIEMFRFGSGDTGRLIVAGIHGGNEGNTVLLAHELIDHVASHLEIVPADISLYIIPNLNPDGYASGRTLEGRVNDNGVDLNRNWPWNWHRDWRRGGCWNYRPVTGGRFALSEPETRWLFKFITDHPEVDALISYHAAALGIFAGGVPDYRPSINLAKTLAGVSDYQYPPIDTGCMMTGDLTDWAATQGIAAVDIELHNFRFTDLPENLAVLKAFLQFRRAQYQTPDHP